MPKYDVEIAWCATIRGYEVVTVEAESEDEARDKAEDELSIDYNEYVKVIDSDTDITSVTEIED